MKVVMLSTVFIQIAIAIYPQVLPVISCVAEHLRQTGIMSHRDSVRTLRTPLSSGVLPGNGRTTYLLLAAIHLAWNTANDHHSHAKYNAPQ